jgi:hypothetical protein
MNIAHNKKIASGNKTYTRDDKVRDSPIDKIKIGIIFFRGKIIRNLLKTRIEPPKTVIAKDKAMISISGINIKVL